MNGPADATAASAAAWMGAAFTGASVRRVDVPEPDLVVLTLHHAHRDQVLVLSARDDAAGLGLVAARPRGAPAGAFAGLLRKHLGGARLADVEARSVSALGLVFRRATITVELVLSLARRGSVIVLLDASSRVLGGAPPGAIAARELTPGDLFVASQRSSGAEWPTSLEALALAGVHLAESRRDHGTEAREAALARALVRETARLRRRALAIENDLDKARGAEALRLEGTALLANLAAIPARASVAEVVDPVTGAALRIDLDPSVPPSTNANRLFVRARKLDRGRVVATARLAETRQALERLELASDHLAGGDAGPAEALLREARAGKHRAPGLASPPVGLPQREPFRRYRSTDGAEILVGRSARDNDRLTFAHARPNDLWLHARGQTGSHVILVSDGGRSPSDAALRDAALLAAHFSASRGDIAADVLCVERRLVRRARKGAPGAVVVAGAPSIRVRLDPERIAALLATHVA